MAGKPIEIPISVIADDVSGIDKVSKGFEEVEDSLKDAEKAGDKAAKGLSDSFEKVEDDLKGVGKASDTATDALKGDFSAAGKSMSGDMSDAAKKFEAVLTQSLDEVESKSKSAGNSIGTNIKRGTDEAGEGLSNFKDEANSTAREAGASFDGSAEGIADAFQEVAANAFAGFGPAGAAAGLLIAVGIGVAIAKINEFAEANTEAKEEMASLAKEIYKAGGALDDAAIAEKIEEIAFALSEEDNPWTPWANEAKTGIGEVRDAVGDLDRDLSKDIFKGLAGDTEAGQRAFDKLTESIERDKEALKGHQDITEQGIPFYDEQGQKIKESIDKREALVKKIEEETGASQDATAEAQYYRDVMGETSDAVEERKQKEEDLKAAQEERTEATQRAIDADRETIETNLDVLDSLDNLTEKIKDNGNTMDENTAKGRENQRAAIDSADAITENANAQIAAGEDIASVTGKFQAQRDELINRLTPAFGGSREAAAKYVDQILKVPGSVKTTVQLDKTDAEQKLFDLQRNRPIPMTVTVNGDAVDKYFWSQQGRKIFVDIAPRGGGQAHQMP